MHRRLLWFLWLLSVSLDAQEARTSDAPVIASEVMVTMRDGIELATDLYFPATNGAKLEAKFPVILTRTPYNKAGAQKLGEYFAKNGYVVVAQDCRGRYGSEGVWHWMSDDGRDGADCAAWIGKQAWFSGKIGMIGTSYVGGTQHALALEGAKELATVIPVDAVSNCGVQSMRNGGAFELRFWNWIMMNAANGSQAGKNPPTAAMLKEMSANRLHFLSELPVRKGMTPLQFAPEYEEWLIDAMRHGKNDAFWAQNHILGQADSYQDIPVYLVGGWYDSWAGNTTANFGVLSKALKSDVYLIMGPWIHGAQGASAHGQVDFGKEAAIPDELAWRLEWYDHWLKGRENSVGKAAPFATKVRIFTMGTGDGHKTEDGKLFHGGHWRDEQSWPPASSNPVPFFFGPGGTLTQVAPTQEAASTTFVFDPADPVPTIGGNISSGNDILLQGGWDQRGGDHVWNWNHPIPLTARNDILVFETGPLAEDVEVTGEIEVKLWASSTAVDTDFTAKLVDVYPPTDDWPGGFDLKITEGILRARFRESLAEEKLMEPGTVYPFTIRVYPTSNLFKKGHRLRVEVSSSNFPRFDVNPNTGEPLGEHRRTVVAENTIFFDAAHPSAIVLPVGAPGIRGPTSLK